MHGFWEIRNFHWKVGRKNITIASFPTTKKTKDLEDLVYILSHFNNQLYQYLYG